MDRTIAGMQPESGFDEVVHNVVTRRPRVAFDAFCTTPRNVARQLTTRARRTTRPPAFNTRGAAHRRQHASEEAVGSVIKKRRKKMRKHKKRKLLKRARHKRKR